MRDVSKAAVDRWGHEAQMLMVAEEAIELAHALLKYRRSWKKYNEQGVDLTREEDGLEKKAHSRALMKVTKNVMTEAMQLTFMLDQLKVMLPGDYESVLDEVLVDCAQLLRNRGVEI